MQHRSWALIALAYLAFAEVLSLAPVPSLSLCLIKEPDSQQTSEHNQPKYCPAFHTGFALLVARADHFLESHDKSVVGGFTIVLAISTIGLWLATNKLWAAGERQLEVVARTAERQAADTERSLRLAEAANQLNHNNFIATQRPWLDLDVQNIGPFHGNSERGMLQLRISAKNRGGSPALAVDCHVVTFPEMNGLNEIETYEELASTLVNQPLAQNGWGRTIFPGDNTYFNEAATAATWHRANIAQGMATGRIFGSPTLTICVCVTYMSGAGDIRYTSGRIYLVMKRIEAPFDAYQSFDLSVSPVPMEDIFLALHPLGMRMT